MPDKNVARAQAPRSAGKGNGEVSQLRWRLELSKTDGDRFDDWSLDASGNVWFSKIIENDSDVAAIVCAGTERSLKRRECLIASAPDLLEACERCIELLETVEAKALVGDEGCIWPVEIMRAAIAKARAKPEAK